MGRGHKIEPNPALTGVWFTFTAERRTGLNSGGHVDSRHSQPPNTPRGTFDPVTVSTQAGSYLGLSTYTASQVSSIYRIYGTVCNCNMPCNTPSYVSHVDVTVQVPDLVALGTSDDYELIGAAPVNNNHNHGTVADTHYFTSANRTRMVDIANQYRLEFPNSPKLHINDASLIWGGLFDYNGTWAPPHSGHRDGRHVDVDKYTIPSGNWGRFEQIVTQHGGDPERHPLNDPNWNHYHIIFP